MRVVWAGVGIGLRGGLEAAPVGKSTGWIGQH